MPSDVAHANGPSVIFRAFLVVGMYTFLASHSKAADPPKPIKITGTVIDASATPVRSGSIHVTFASDKVGDEDVDISEGKFTIEKPLPEKVSYPLMVKLSFHVTIGKEKLPPRIVEHLSPRQPQELHVVMYTDKQL